MCALGPPTEVAQWACVEITQLSTSVHVLKIVNS